MYSSPPKRSSTLKRQHDVKPKPIKTSRSTSTLNDIRAAIEDDDPYYDTIPDSPPSPKFDRPTALGKPPVFPPKCTAEKQRRVAVVTETMELKLDRIRDLFPEPSPLDVLAPNKALSKKVEKPLQLSQLYERQYQDMLPFKLRVRAGMYGDDNFSTFSESDEIAVHFLHKLDYVVLQTQQKKQYHIPIASTFLFAPLYNPQSKLTTEGFIFSSPGMLIDANPQPQFVSVLYIDDAETEVCIGDILSVEGEVKRASSKWKSSCLKCINIRTGKEKFLPRSMQISFTTKPSQLMVPLQLLFKYLVACPVSAMMQAPAKTPSTVLSRFLKEIPAHEPVTLQYRSNKTIAIASRTLTFDDVRSIFELPLDFPLDICIVPMDEADTSQLQYSTADIYQGLNFEGGVNCKLLIKQSSNLASCNTDVQQALFTMVDSNELRKHFISPPCLNLMRSAKTVGFKEQSKAARSFYDTKRITGGPVKFEDATGLAPTQSKSELTPACVGGVAGGSSKRPEMCGDTCKTVEPSVPPLPLKSPPGNMPFSHIEKCDMTNREKASPPASQLEMPLYKVAPAPTATPSVSKPRSRVDQYDDVVPTAKPLVQSQEALNNKRLKALEESFNQLQTELEVVKKTVADLQDKQGEAKMIAGKHHQLPKSPYTNTVNPRPLESSLDASDDRMQSNVKYLQTLSTEQIGILLEEKKLNQYVRIFRDLDIDGDVLIQLTEADLERELNVTTRLHRVFLMNLITGKQSAYELLSKAQATNYVMFAPN